MDAMLILLANGFFLSFILLVLLIVLSVTTNHPHKKRKNVSEDLKKIKDQINGDD